MNDFESTGKETMRKITISYFYDTELKYTYYTDKLDQWVD